MNRAFILALACSVCAIQVASAEAAGSKTKVAGSSNSQNSKQNITKAKPIVDPVKGPTNLSGLNGGKAIDPGYFGGTNKQNTPITFGGNPPRANGGAGATGTTTPITFGGNPPRAPSQPTNGDCHSGCHDGHGHVCHDHDCHDCDHYCHDHYCHDRFCGWMGMFGFGSDDVCCDDCDSCCW